MTAYDVRGTAVTVGEVVQITDPEHTMFPCLAVVREERRDHGVMAYVIVPTEAGRTGNAFIFLDSCDFTSLGRRAAIYLADSEEDDAA